MKDDGIAIAVAQELKNSPLSQSIEIIIGETDSYWCFDQINRNDFVIILDALYPDMLPGSVHVFSLNKALAQDSNCTGQHDMSIIDLMRIYKLNLNGYIIGIETAEVELGYDFSNSLARKFDKICADVRKSIDNIVLEVPNYA